MHAMDVAVTPENNIIKNLESLHHPYAEDAIEFITSILDIADDMYVILVNELGRSRTTEAFMKLVTNE